MKDQASKTVLLQGILKNDLYQFQIPLTKSTRSMEQQDIQKQNKSSTGSTLILKTCFIKHITQTSMCNHLVLQHISVN